MRVNWVLLTRRCLDCVLLHSIQTSPIMTLELVFTTWKQIWLLQSLDGIFGTTAKPTNRKDSIRTWWLQPIWKIWVKLDFPKFQDEHKKNIWNVTTQWLYHPEMCFETWGITPNPSLWRPKNPVLSRGTCNSISRGYIFPRKLTWNLKRMVSKISFSRGAFSGSMLVFGGVIIAIAYSFSAIYSFYTHHWYPSSHCHGSVENGCISEKNYLSFHFHDGRKRNLTSIHL